MAAQDLNIQIVATDKTGAAFKSVKSSINDLNGTVTSVTGKIAALTSVLGAIGIGAQIKGVIDAADNMNKLSQKTGIAVTELSSLSNTADLAGVSNEQLGSALIKLNKSIADASSGAKEQSEAFANLGIKVKDANGNIRPTSSILADVSEAFAGAADGATKTQYAMALFGKAGADLIPFLNLGKEGIREFGATFGDEFAQNAEKFNDSLTRLNQQFNVFLVESIGPSINGLTRFIAELQEGIKYSNGFFDAIFNLGTINPYKSTGDNLKEVRSEIEENNAAIERYKKANSDTRSLEEYNKHLQNRLGYLKAMERLEVNGATAIENQSAAESKRLGLMARTKVMLPGLSKAEPKKAQKTEAEKELEKIQAAYVAVSDEINKLVYGEDELAIRQFERITNDKIAIEQYRVLLAEKRRLIDADKEQEEQTKAQERLDNLATEAAKKKAAELKSLWEETRTPLEKYNEEVERLYELLLKGDVDLDTYYRKLDLLGKGLSDFGKDGKDTFQELTDAINGWGNEFTNVMAESVMSGKLSFNDLANSIIKDLLRIQIQKSITKPLIEAGTSFLDGLLSGQRAMGGPVTAGQSYLVGENGPEIFTPGASGGITANNQLGGSGVTVVQNINVTTGVQQTVRAEIMTLMPQIAGAAKAAVADAKLRGGNYAAALR